MLVVCLVLGILVLGFTYFWACVFGVSGFPNLSIFLIADFLGFLVLILVVNLVHCLLVPVWVGGLCCYLAGFSAYLTSLLFWV